MDENKPAPKPKLRPQETKKQEPAQETTPTPPKKPTPLKDNPAKGTPPAAALAQSRKSTL